MSDKILVPREELECLRRHLAEANRLLQVLGVREPEAPKLTKRQQRIKHFSEKLTVGTRRKKS